MDSESASFNTAVHKHNKYFFFNGKKYYIEVYQCSGEDMNQILLGLVPSNLIPRQTIYSPHRTHHPPPLHHPLSNYSSPSLTPSSNTNYYPMHVIYYPQPSIYLPTGPMHSSTPMTVLLRGKFASTCFIASSSVVFLGDHGQYS